MHYQVKLHIHLGKCKTSLATLLSYAKWKNKIYQVGWCHKELEKLNPADGWSLIWGRKANQDDIKMNLIKLPCAQDARNDSFEGN